MTKKIIFMGLSALTITLAGCSWTDRQIGPIMRFPGTLTSQ